MVSLLPSFLILILRAYIGSTLAADNPHDDSNDHNEPCDGDALQEEQKAEEEPADIFVERDTFRGWIQKRLEDV